MIKAILFDVDGVILFPLNTFFSDRLAEKLGIPLSKIVPFFEKEYQQCLVGQLDLKEALVPYVREWQWTGSIDELLSFWFEAEAEVDANLIASIDNLRAKGLTCFVATNQEKYRAEYMFKQIGFNGSFDKLYAAGKLGVAKPDHAFFQHITDDLPDIPKDEILFWDDKQHNVEAARQFGILAEHYTSREDFDAKMKGYLGE